MQRRTAGLEVRGVSGQPRLRRAGEQCQRIAVGTRVLSGQTLIGSNITYRERSYNYRFINFDFAVSFHIFELFF